MSFFVQLSLEMLSEEFYQCNFCSNCSMKCLVRSITNEIL